MIIDSAYYSAVGGRSNNEDAASLLYSDTQLLAVVADGLGGHARGEVASHLAVQTLNDELFGKSVSMMAMKRAIKTANHAVLHHPDGSGMKTTAAVAWTDGLRLVLGTVGDTRIYQFRGGAVAFQSVDHSVSQLSVMAGVITKEQIRGDIDRNKLLRVLGNQEEVKADITKLKLQRGDALLLCSDGFWENIVEDKMLELLARASSSKQWLGEMREIVRAEGGSYADNHTAVALIVR